MENLSNVFNKANNITLIKEGEHINIDKKNPIFTEFLTLITNSYYQPVFSVSLHEAVVQQLKNGLWLKFDFEPCANFLNMPFSSLLIELEPKLSGLTIIRFCENKYQGRNLFLNLSKKTTEFYKLINK